MATAFTISGQLLVLMASLIAVHAFPSYQNVTCVVGGRSYQAGETIGDPCDGCVCTQYGTMCQLRSCEPSLCVDKVRAPGECCYTCPTGPNCEYTGNLGRSLIPAAGCRYSENIVCYCYESRSAGMMPFCLPPFPWERKEPCNITTPNTPTFGNQISRFDTYEMH